MPNIPGVKQAGARRNMPRPGQSPREVLRGSRLEPTPPDTDVPGIFDPAQIPPSKLQELPGAARTGETGDPDVFEPQPSYPGKPAVFEPLRAPAAPTTYPGLPGGEITPEEGGAPPADSGAAEGAPSAPEGDRPPRGDRGPRRDRGPR